MHDDRHLARVTLEQDVGVMRRDGTRLRADVYRPVGQGPCPTLVMRLPYDKRVAQTYWYASPAWYASQGYTVVVEDVRGRFSSEGVFKPLTMEASDTVDLLRWTAEQPWSNGRLGTYGYSYAGLLQLLAASRCGDVPLQAIAPALTPPGLGEGCLQQNGVTAASFLVGWAAELGALTVDVAAPGSLRRLANRPFLELRDSIPPGVGDWANTWLEQDLDDAYWHQSSMVPDYDAVTAAALHIGGWYDTFRRATVEHFQASRAGKGRPPGADRLVVGAWSHQPRRSRRRGAELAPFWDVDALQLDFFDAVLRDRPTDADCVRVAILNSPDSYAGDSWPPPGLVETDWHLRSGGRAASADGDGELSMDGPGGAPADFLHYDHANPVPAAGGDDCGDPAVVGMGPRDQAAVELRSDVLVYSSPPMPSDTLVLGSADMVLYFESSDEIAQWVARLCLVDQSGISRNIAETVVRIALTEPGPHRVELSFGPIAVRIGAGECLRLHVTNGSSPRWAPLRDRKSRPIASRSVVLHDRDHPSVLTLRQVA
jgi:uncharacterized protein